MDAAEISARLASAHEVILRFGELDPAPANAWDLTAAERAAVRDLLGPLAVLAGLISAAQAGRDA